MMDSSILNRLKKNYQKISRWAEKNNITAFRIYDRDIPEYQFILDFYDGFGVMYDKSNPELIPRDLEHRIQFESALDSLPFEWKGFFKKERRKQEGIHQYSKLSTDKQTLVVHEGAAKFQVNLSDYIDTGLFLDHRSLRYKIYKTSKNKRVLNLFCYTGSFSVMAALGGGSTTSIDLSNTYLDWAKDNFKLNKISGPHQFIEADILDLLPQHKEQYDIVILDPPTFSNSKKMTSNFEVQRDHMTLVESAMTLLKNDGRLYFSNNKRDFKLDPQVSKIYDTKDITLDTIPIDFHDKKIHRCFEISHKA